jgi:tetratricopeptide (TPR) repeat protein
MHHEALTIRLDLGLRQDALESNIQLAILALRRKQGPKARQMFLKSLDESEEIGALPMQARCLVHLGELALTEQRFEESRRRLVEGFSIAQDIDDRPLEISALRHMATLALATGDPSEATSKAKQAHQLAQSLGPKCAQGQTLLTLAEVLGDCLFDATSTSKNNTSPEPEVLYKRGIDLFRSIGNTKELATGLEQFGKFRIERGETSAGQHLLEEACHLYTSLGLQNDSQAKAILDQL